MMFRTAASRSPLAKEDNPNDDAASRVEFTVRPEALRFATYCFFWSMSLFAFLLTKYVVRPILLAGPTDGQSSPPFDTGEGFDIYTDSHLIRAFGFNNICSNWDYSPAREIIAIYFPLFEYSLVLYIIADYINVMLHWKKGLVSTRCYKTFQVLLPLILFGCALFRLIFVFIAYENLQGHTMGFLFLQVSLILTACLNVWFVVEAKIEYRCFCGHTKEFAYAYLFCNVPLSLLKLGTTFQAVYAGTYPSWASSPVGEGGVATGQVLDWMWMVFNAVVPFCLSYVRSRTENPLEISIDVAPLRCTSGSGRIADEGEDSRGARDAGSAPLSGASDFPGVRELAAPRRGETLPLRRALDLRPNAGKRTGGDYCLWRANIAPTVRGNIARPPLKGSHPAYPFENVAFQGGGAKGVVYTGAIQALDELGVLPYLKRFGGASAGSLPALFLSLGLDSEQVLEETKNIDMTEYFDASGVKYGYNLVKKLGFHPANKCVENIEGYLEKYTGDKDLTFLGLYQRYGTELCISASNVSRHQEEYFHVNTTPDLPIKIAIRTSMSVPILWAPVDIGGDKYVDGGLFNNYPLKAFDGWYLSTRKEDGIIPKTIEANPNILEEGTHMFEYIEAMNKSMSSSFAEPNMATIGFRVTADVAPDQATYASYLTQLESKFFHQDSRRMSLDSRMLLRKDGVFLSLLNNGENEPDRSQPEILYPPTKLARAYEKKKDSEETNTVSNAAVYEDAYVEMFRWMILHMKDHVGSDLHPHAMMSSILMRELQDNPPKEPLKPGLFGCNSWSEVVASMDSKSKGYVTRTDLGHFWGRFGVRHTYMKNRKPQTINSIRTLMGQLMEAMHTISEENLMRDENNASRTCTLNTFYVDFLDLKLEQADKAFLIGHGKDATLNWIKQRARELTTKKRIKKVMLRKRSSGTPDQIQDQTEKPLMEKRASDLSLFTFADDSDHQGEGKLRSEQNMKSPASADKEKVEEVEEGDAVASLMEGNERKKEKEEGVYIGMINEAGEEMVGESEEEEEEESEGMDECATREDPPELDRVGSRMMCDGVPEEGWQAEQLGDVDSAFFNVWEKGGTCIGLIGVPNGASLSFWDLRSAIRTQLRIDCFQFVLGNLAPLSPDMEGWNVYDRDFRGVLLEGDGTMAHPYKIEIAMRREDETDDWTVAMDDLL